MLKIVENGTKKEEGNETQTLDELAREGARRMLAQALHEEVRAYVDGHATERDARGHAVVTRNGRAETRKVTMGSGTVEISAPRVRDEGVEHGVRRKFTSAILPPYMRRSPKVTEVLPVLYLRGLSTGDFRPALEGLLGEDAAGLSSANIARLTSGWDTEYQQFRKRSLADKDYVYIWVDGIHFNVRLEEHRLCTLVIIGAMTDGTKELIAVEDGYRESTESWAMLLRDLQRRGMRAPAVAVGDGALGFWAAVSNVWPETRRQRDWCHKLANVLDKLPKRLQPRAKEMLREAMYAPSRSEAQRAIALFVTEFSAKYPKAASCLSDDEEALCTHFDFPAEHWKHIRTTNVIESPFATVRLRQRTTKGAGSRAKAILMAFKLLDMAQQRWRKLDGKPELLKLVREGAVFADGIINKNMRKSAA